MLITLLPVLGKSITFEALAEGAHNGELWQLLQSHAAARARTELLQVGLLRVEVPVSSQRRRSSIHFGGVVTVFGTFRALLEHLSTCRSIREVSTTAFSLRKPPHQDPRRLEMLKVDRHLDLQELLNPKSK